MIALLAGLVGGSLPLVAMAIFVRRRSAALRRALGARSVRRTAFRRRSHERRNTLGWLRGTIGATDRPLPPRTPPASRTCGRCRYVNEGIAIYCRRCGTRIFDRRP